jgi:PKD repeat protein
MNFVKFLSWIFLIFFTLSSVHAQKVEDVFIDISSNYRYKNELQFLYDNGHISQNNSQYFFPNKNINRDEFVSILMETNCSDCTYPDTSWDLISTYQNKNVYNDVNNNSQYYYCVAQADEKKYIQWYQFGTVCNNGAQISWTPFCPENSITLEESLAVIMRASDILSQENAEKILKEIKNGKSYPTIGKDIVPKYSNWDVNSFYPYFYVAHNYNFSEFSISGEEKTYFLLPQDQEYYFPKNPITKEQMIFFAHFVAKNNKCSVPSENLSGNIALLQWSCAPGQSCESNTDYSKDSQIDFEANISSSCPLGVDESNYKWVLFHLDSWKHFIFTGKYIDNYSFTLSGNYRIKLEVIDNCGNRFTQNDTFFIEDSKKNIFSGFIHKNVFQDNNSVDFFSEISGNNWPYTYLWDFGDGNTSNDKNPSHLYNQDGTYYVTLKVTDADGNIKELYTQVEFNSEDGNTIQQDTFTVWDNHWVDFIAPGWEEAKYSWDFGDGNTSTDKNPRHMYSEPGIYEVNLVVEENGEIKNYTYTIEIWDDNYVIDANVEQEFEWNTYKFSADILNSQEGDFTYWWDFGDGNTSNQQNPIHEYQWEWPFEVILTVTDENWNTQEKKLTVYPKSPQLKIDLDVSKNNSRSYWFNGVVIDWEGPFEYLWDFGDGKSSTEKNPSHLFQYPWEYPVVLTITDKNGNSQQVTSNIFINQWESGFNAEISYEWDDFIAPEQINFSSEIIWDKTEEYKYIWDFGDGSQSTWDNPSHIYTEPGDYRVTLIIENSQWEQIVKSLVVNISQWDIQDLQTDSDNDGILDEDDNCPDIKWEQQNNWCPIFETFCENDSQCPQGSKCGTINWNQKTCISTQENLSCNYNGGSYVAWNVVCDTCPCQNTLNFKAQIRACDIIFPAITSPDGNKIFSKWKYFQIK